MGERQEGIMGQTEKRIRKGEDKRGVITRPRGSRDKSIRPGMVICKMPDGSIQARHRLRAGAVVIGRLLGNDRSIAISIDSPGGSIGSISELAEGIHVDVGRIA
jgi:hypothetical protein